MSTRIAVTGRQGQVARALAEAGSALDVEIINLGRPQPDLAVPETVQPALTAVRPDVVVNATAYTAVDQAEREREQAGAINAIGTGAVAAAASALGVPIIHLSTDYVFAGDKGAPYVEEDPVAPSGVYGASKLAGEKAVAAATQDHVILRTAWVYAPYGKNFVRTMLAMAQTRDEIRVVADQHGSPSYAPDIAVAIIAIARNLTRNPSDCLLRGIFHLAGRGETSWAQLSREFAGRRAGASAIFGLLPAKGLRRPALNPIATAMLSKLVEHFDPEQHRVREDITIVSPKFEDEDKIKVPGNKRHSKE